MGSKPEATLRAFLCLLILIILPISHSSTTSGSSNQANFIFYIHDYSGQRNATTVPIVGITGKPWTFTSFGTIFAVDASVTLASNPNSPTLGRVQGLLVTSSVDGSYMQLLLSFLFTQRQSMGNTLQVQGLTRQSDTFREVSIVSGTGTYRFARGFAILNTVFYDPNTSYSRVRVNITLLTS